MYKYPSKSEVTLRNLINVKKKKSEVRNVLQKLYNSISFIGIFRSSTNCDFPKKEKGNKKLFPNVGIFPHWVMCLIKRWNFQPLQREGVVIVTREEDCFQITISLVLENTKQIILSLVEENMRNERKKDKKY